MVAAVTTCLLWHPSAVSAELVRLRSGRTLSVTTIAADPATGTTTLSLRGGGEVRCDTSLISAVLPDEQPSTPSALPESAPARGVPSTPESDGPVRFEPSLEHLPYGPLVTRVALAEGLRPSLIHAIVSVESGHDALARSPKGAGGLMQLMPATAKDHGVDNRFDPEGNLAAGVRHLRDLLSRHSLPVALAAYNAGEGAVQRYRGIPPFAETRAYVERVLLAFQRLSGHRPGNARVSGSAGPDRAGGADVQPMRAQREGRGDSAIISQ